MVGHQQKHFIHAVSYKSYLLQVFHIFAVQCVTYEANVTNEPMTPASRSKGFPVDENITVLPSTHGFNPPNVTF